MKKCRLIVSLALAATLLLSCCATVLAAPLIGSKTTELPEAGILDVTFGDKTLSAKSPALGLEEVPIREYSKGGEAGLKEEPGNVGKVKVMVDSREYTAMGFAKASSGNTIGISFKELNQKDALTAALTKGFTLETSFVMPAASSEAALIGATTGGGFGLFVSSDGKLFFEIGQAGGGYADLYSEAIPAGTYCHVVGAADPVNGKMTLYLNGAFVGELDYPGFRAGGYLGRIGIGGSTAADDHNYTNFACNPTTFTSLRIYSEAFGADKAVAAYLRHLYQELSAEPDAGAVMPPAPDLLKLTFGAQSITAESTLEVSANEYSSSGVIRDPATSVGEQTVTVNGKELKVFGLKKDSSTDAIGVTFNKAALATELAKGFTLEAAFVIPEGLSGEQYFVAAMQGGGFGICSVDGMLSFEFHDGTGYKTVRAELPAVGTYCHVAAVFDAEAKEIRMVLNGEPVGSTPAERFNGGGWYGVMGVGGSTASATNFTKYPVPKDTILTKADLYSTALTNAQAKGAYQKHLADIGAGELPGEDVPVGTEPLELTFREKGVTYASSLEQVSIKEYSSSGNAKAGFPNVGRVDAVIGGKNYKTYGFTMSGRTNQLGVTFDKEALAEHLSDGFALELSFIVPSEFPDGYSYLTAAMNAGGFGIGHYEGKLFFEFQDGTGYKTVETEMPAAGTYCHVVASFDAQTKEIRMILNGAPIGSTPVERFNGGGWYGVLSIGGSTASATNFTKYGCAAGTTITGLTLHEKAKTDEEAIALYAVEMAKFGILVTPEYGKDYDDDFEPVVRFVVASDVHVGSAGDNRNVRLQKLLAQSYVLSRNAGNHYENFDAIFLVGDLADNGRADQLQAVKSTLDAGLDPNETQAITLMGNHEYYDGNNLAVFESVMGEGSANVHKIINGYHFIGISPDESARHGWDYNAETYAWVEAQVAAAYADTGADKPIFVFQHVPDFQQEYGTCEHVGSEGGTPTLQSIYERYPNVVRFAGHIHAPITDEYIIYQNKYTSLGTGTLHYSTRPTANGEKMDMNNRYSTDQAYVVEVDAANRTRVRVWDISENKFVAGTYILDSYKTEDFKYNENRFTEEDLFFADDAELNLVKVTGNLAAFSFSPVSPDSITARGYHLVVEDTAGKVVKQRYVSWDYFNLDYTTPIKSALGGLTPETDYVLKVYAVTAGYCSELTCERHRMTSQPLVQNFRTAAVAQGEVKADILDVSIDAQAGTIRDISDNAMQAKVYGSPVISHDDTIGMDVITFPGNCSNVVRFADYVSKADEMAYGFTFETYFKANEMPSSSSSPVSSQQAAGFGFDVQNGQAIYSIHNGSYKTLTKTIDTEHYYHFVAVYNGENTVLFVNGHKIGIVSVEAPVLFPQDAGKVLFLGSDTTDAGNPERAMKCSVALARLYSAALSDEQAIALFDPIKEKQDPELYKALENDPEYLFWEPIDDGDTDYVTFMDSKKNVHDHADDNASKPVLTPDGELFFWTGSHLYKSKCHSISGALQCRLNFVGTGFRYVLFYRGPADSYGTGVDVYIDGQFYKTVTDINGLNLTSRYTALEVTGLADKRHEITFVSHDGRRVMMDAFDIVRGTGAEDDGAPIPDPVIGKEDNDLFKLDSCKDGGFAAFTPTTANGYAAYFLRAKLDPNKTYTLEYDVISNIDGMEVYTDLEGNPDFPNPLVSSVSPTKTWQHKTHELRTSLNWAESSMADVASLGWALRVYLNTPINGQAFIDNLVLKDEAGEIVYRQDFSKEKVEGVESWLAGNAAYIAPGYQPPAEEEELGYNELLGGDFEDADRMKYWWVRSDWNGGLFRREAGKGFDGSYGLVATGRGNGEPERNAGVYYSLLGEGHEDSLTLKEGETYVISYKVFRPDGVNANVYLDISGKANAPASLHGEWETVTARFVAGKDPIVLRIVANALKEGEQIYIDDVELRMVGGDPNGTPNTGGIPNTGDALPYLLAALSASALGCGAALYLRRRKADQ